MDSIENHIYQSTILYLIRIKFSNNWTLILLLYTLNHKLLQTHLPIAVRLIQPSQYQNCLIHEQ